MALSGAGKLGGKRELTAFTIAQPAAGAQAQRTVPGGFWERLVCITYQLVTSAAAANRTTGIELRDGDGNRIGFQGPDRIYAATTTTIVCLNIGTPTGSQSTTLTRFTAALVDVWLPPGFTFAIIVDNIQAADQLSAIRGIVERSPDEYSYYTLGAEVAGDEN